MLSYISSSSRQLTAAAAAAAAKSLQSCLTLCDPIDGLPPGSPSLGFSRQEHWSGLPLPSPMHESESEGAQSCPTLSDPMDCSLRGSSLYGIFQARVLEWGATAFSRQVTVMNNNWLGKVSKLHAIYCCWVESLILSSLILRSNFLGLLQAYWIFLFILTKCREERRLIENMWKHAYFISSITSVFLFSNSSLIITKMNKTGA